MATKHMNRLLFQTQGFFYRSVAASRALQTSHKCSVGPSSSFAVKRIEPAGFSNSAASVRAQIGPQTFQFPPMPPRFGSSGRGEGEGGDRNDGRMGSRMFFTRTLDSDLEESSFGSDRSRYVRFVTYNVLSSKLSAPTHFTENDPEALDAGNRLEKLLAKLEREIGFRSIICLQEVSTSWYGELHCFFARHGYQIIFAPYGQRFNGYMGVAVAIPIKDYEILTVNVKRVADVKPWPKPPIAEETALSKFVTGFKSSRLGRIWRAATAPLKPPRPRESGWSYAQRRYNAIVFARLKSRTNGQVFCVANYHMPCAFFNPQAMNIHVALAMQFIEGLSANDPLVFCGDFNVKPDSSSYRLITEGDIPEDDPTYPQMPEQDPWVPTVPRKLHSAYKLFTGTEPDFTNFAKVKEQPVFTETLDYIFITPGLEVVDVEHLPHRDDVMGPLPNMDEPSDHILLAATIQMPAPATDMETKPVEAAEELQGQEPVPPDDSGGDAKVRE